MPAGGGASESGPAASIDRPASEETTGAGESGRPWASRSRPRKLSADISATRFRQSGHGSRCLLTASAVPSSSLPSPYELRVWSVGWLTGWAFIGRSPETGRVTVSEEERPVPPRTCRKKRL